MKFTETIERFNPNAFDIGRLYYIHMNSNDMTFKGIFLCYDKDKESREVEFVVVTELQGTSLCRSTMIGEKDLPHIKEIQPVEFNVEYDTNFAEWRIFTNIETGDT